MHIAEHISTTKHSTRIALNICNVASNVILKHHFFNVNLLNSIQFLMIENDVSLISKFDNTATKSFF